jgi:hypothetical protein
MSILIGFLVMQASAASAEASQAAPSVPAVAPARKAESRTCREMLLSSSRLGPVRVCKTKAQWERWQRCHGATRYCAPPQKQTVTVASLPGDELVCKYIKETGSRLAQQKVCATKRQWEITELEAQELLRQRQSTSTLVSE